MKKLTTPTGYGNIHSGIVKLLEVARRAAARSNAAVARYALEGLHNKVLAAEYQTVLPGENLIAEELERSRRELEARRLAKPRSKGRT